MPLTLSTGQDLIVTGLVQGTDLTSTDDITVGDDLILGDFTNGPLKLNKETISSGNVEPISLSNLGHSITYRYSYAQFATAVETPILLTLSNDSSYWLELSAVCRDSGGNVHCSKSFYLLNKEAGVDATITTYSDLTQANGIGTGTGWSIDLGTPSGANIAIEVDAESDVNWAITLTYQGVV